MTLLPPVQACRFSGKRMVAKYALLCTLCGGWSFLLVARYTEYINKLRRRTDGRTYVGSR